jgi:hypothetical protein
VTLHRIRTHPDYVDGCFGCKASTLQLANGEIRAWAHSQEKELNDYRSARKYGIQPRSTKQRDVDGAVRASEALGKAVQAR